MRSTVKTSILLSVGLCGGCAEDQLPPILWETERAIIGSELEGFELCHDDFAMLDEHVALVEDMLGVERSSKLKVYFYDLDGLPCGVSPQGCYRHDTDQIHMATWDGLDHEIVHAVAPDSFPSLFWEEGTADALRWVGTIGDGERVLENATKNRPEELDYLNARHFVRWIIETHGLESLRRIISGATEEEATGSSFDELAAAHRESVPYAYPALEPYICPFDALPELEAGVWQEDFDLGCDQPGATGVGGVGGVSVVRTIDLEPGRYRLVQRGGSFTALLGCQLTPNEAPLPEMFHGAAFNEAELSRKAPPTYYPAEEEHILDVTRGGRVRVTVVGEEEGRFAGSIEFARLE